MNKAINEMYRQHQPTQYPVIVLNVIIHGKLVDVNVTPDKRKFFLSDEDAVVDHIRVCERYFYNGRLC